MSGNLSIWSTTTYIPFLNATLKQAAQNLLETNKMFLFLQLLLT